MDTLRSFPVITLSTLLFFYTGTARGTTFTFANKCGDTIWPGILSNAGSPELGSTGFELASGSTRSFQAPTGWSGRFWARTGCAFGAPGGTCTTGDCGSGAAECGGAGATPPATLAEFTLAGPTSDKDFYDVSLVDGYNLPLLVDASGGCQATGCAADLNRGCPAELKTSGGCRSACEAFGTPEFCCAGEFSTPATCRPSVYSEMFKTACPKSYSYAYDDATSTFTCSGADYTITFCPDSSPSSQKSSRDNSNTPSAPKTATGGVMLEDGSWLASLATGSANAARKSAYPSLLMHLLAAGYIAYVLLLL